MKTLHNLLSAALFGAVATVQAFAGYTAPDSNVYTYKIVQWYKNVVDDYTDDWFQNFDLWGFNHYLGVNGPNTYEAAIVVYGPTGIEDFAGAKRTVSLLHTDVSYEVFRTATLFTPTVNSVWQRSYVQMYGSILDDYLDSDATAGSLILTVPAAVIPGGTTSSGVDFYTEISPAPANIVPGPAQISGDYTGGNYESYTATHGEQLWVQITWTNIPPGKASAPDAPDWTDPEWVDPNAPEIQE